MTIPNGSSLTRRRDRFHEAALKGVFTLADWNKLSVGTSYLVDAVKSPAEKIDKKMSSTFATFVQDEMTLKCGFGALFGVRYVYNQNFHGAPTTRWATRPPR